MTFIQNYLLKDQHKIILNKETQIKLEEIANNEKKRRVIFFHYFTLHGSMPNRSNQTRKTVLVQLHSGKDQVEDGNSHTNSRLVLRGWNHRANRTSASKI